MRVDQRDQRCVMVTIDPVTLVRNPAILRAIARERDARLGIYGSAVEPGLVSVATRSSSSPRPSVARNSAAAVVSLARAGAPDC